MSFDPEKHHRRSIRLKGYDYARAGMYFVTVCTQHRRCLFGDVVDGEMRLNEAGRMVERWWNVLPARFATIQIDTWIVMPNHIHGIVIINNEKNVSVSAQTKTPQATPAMTTGAPTLVRPYIGKTTPAMTTGAPTLVRPYIGLFNGIKP